VVGGGGYCGFIIAQTAVMSDAKGLIFRWLYYFCGAAGKKNE